MTALVTHSTSLSLLGAGVLAALAVLTPSGAGRAQGVGTCADVETDPKEPNRYKDRKGRCEGLYIRRNNAPYLALLGLTASTAQGSRGPRRADTLRLDWPKLAPDGAIGAKLDLHAMANPGGKHYRMDATPDISAGGYDWPMDVLNSIKMSTELINLEASLPAKLANVQESAHLPIRVGALSGPAISYDFAFEPGADVSALSYKLERYEGGKWVHQAADKPCSYGVGVAKVPFVVAVPQSEVSPPMTYFRVTFAAALGNPATHRNATVVFFHD